MLHWITVAWDDLTTSNFLPFLETLVEVLTSDYKHTLKINHIVT